MPWAWACGATTVISGDRNQKVLPSSVCSTESPSSKASLRTNAVLLRYSEGCR